MLSIAGGREDFPSGDIGAFGARISALALTYGFESPLAEFWVQKKEEKLTALVSRSGGAVTIENFGECDIPEMREFLGVIGFSSVLTDKETALALFGEVSETGSVMRRKGENAEYKTQWQEPPYRRIFRVLELSKSFGKNQPDYGEWLADISAKIRRGTARIAAKTEKGECVSCAMLVSVSENAAILGAVATVPEFRGKGYASALAEELTKTAGERAVYLFCRPEMQSFYEKIGFEICGEYAEITGEIL